MEGNPASQVPTDYLPLPTNARARSLPYLKKIRLPITLIAGLFLLEWLFGHPAVMSMHGGYITIIGEEWNHWETDYDSIVLFMPPKETYLEWLWRHLKGWLPI